jgi:hypothetical protein
MSTTAKTCVGWIVVLLLLCTAGDASATNGFLSENSRQEKNLGQAEIHWEIATLNAESQRVCDDSCFEHAAGSVVGSNTPAKQGIYEFPDQTAGGIPYVGQSGNIPNRLQQHIAKGRLKPGTESTTPVSGGKTDREIAEHIRIQELTGGQAAKNCPNVANKVDPIGPNRRPGFGLPEPTE